MGKETRLDACKIYSQFLVDAPRIDIWLDKELCVDSAGSIFFRVSEKMTSRPALRLIDRCTQGWLAEWYEEGVKKFASKKNHHLVDGGTQTLKITKGPAHLVLNKPFKVVRVPDEDPDEDVKVVHNILLTMEYDPESDKILKKQWDIQEQGWVFA